MDKQSASQQKSRFLAVIVPLASAFFISLCLACSGSQPPSKQPSTSDTGIKNSSDRQKWRWKGARDTCFFVVENRCFDKKEDACKQAGCNDDQCKLVGGGPAAVVCRK